MSFSFKNMIFSFAVGIIIFSLMMIGFCKGVFASEVKVAVIETTQSTNDIKKLSCDKAVLIKSVNDSDEISQSTLVVIDSGAKIISFTKIDADYLVNYKGSLSYFSSLYDLLGDTSIIESVKAFSGITVDESDIIKATKPISGKNDIIYALNQVGVDIEDFQIFEFPLAIASSETQNTHELITVVDIDTSVNNFKKLLGLK